MFVGDLDRVEHGLDLAAPVMEETVEFREGGSDVVLLHHEELQQARMVGQVIMDLHGRETVACDLEREIPVTHQRHLPPSGRTATEKIVTQERFASSERGSGLGEMLARRASLNGTDRIFVRAALGRSARFGFEIGTELCLEALDFRE